MTQDSELSPDEAEAVSALFAQLVDASAADRARALGAPELSPGVLRMVSSLLEHVDATRFGDDFAGDLAGQLVPEPDQPIPDWIGPYRILGRLGQGGMGDVYRAHQSDPVEREVALKVLRIGRISPRMEARFEAERQALALMDHPDIAKVFDGGSTGSGQPYFVMELVHGQPLTEYCDERRLAIEARLELFVRICRAVEHAHQKGVVHRDLKPANVLVAEDQRQALPKVIDFGIAKLTENPLTGRDLATEHEALLGTPQYMAPEQIAGRDIDTRVDVYALGVLLYELLVGVLPFELADEGSGDYHSLLSEILERDPQRPSTRISTVGRRAEAIAERRLLDVRKLHGRIRGDLDWIVVKALEKDRERRYGSAAAFAEDVLRYLAKEPIEARPPSRGYRLQKLVARNRGLVAASAVAFVALVGGITGTALGLREALGANEALEKALVNEEAERLAAVEARDEAKLQLGRAQQVKRVLVQMLSSVDPSVARDLDTRLLQQILRDTIYRLGNGSIPDPRIRAELHAVVARALIQIGEPAAAEEHYLAALETEEVGPDDPIRLAAESAKLSSLVARLQMDEALRIAPQLVEHHRRLAGALTSDEGRVRNTVALAKIRAGRGREALSDMRALLEEAQSTESFEGSVRAYSLRIVAEALLQTGQVAEALQALRESLAANQAIFGDEHIRTIQVRMGMVKALLTLGQNQEASDLVGEVHETTRRTFGSDSRLTQMACVNRNATWMGTERNAEALASMREVLEQARDLPENHNRRLEMLMLLGACLAHAGQNAEAIDKLEASLAGFRANGTDTARSGMQVRSNLVSLYAVAGRHDDAIELANESLAILQDRAEADSLLALEIRSQLVQAFHLAGRSEDAVRAATRVLPTLLRAYGPENRNARVVQASLVESSARLGRENELAAIQRSALEDVVTAGRAATAPFPVRFRAARELLLHPNTEVRDPARGAELARHAAAAADGPSTVPGLLQLGDALRDAGRNQDARAVWSRGLELAPEGSPLREELAARDVGTELPR